MKFAKGLMIGSVITASAMMMCSDEFENNRKKIVKTGKKMMKKIGIY